MTALFISKYYFYLILFYDDTFLNIFEHRIWILTHAE